MRYLYFILCFLSLKLSFAQNYSIRSFQNEEGLSDPFVYSLNQDQQGFLYVATGKGLQRFDGQFFNTVLGERLEDEIIYCGAVNQSNQLWFGSFNGTLYSYIEKTNSLKRFSQTVGGSVSKILPYSQSHGFCIYSKGDGLYTTNGKNLSAISITRELQVNGVELLSDNSVLAACEEGLFSINIEANNYVLLSKEGVGYKSIQKLKNNTFLCLTANSDIQFIKIISNKEIKVLKTIEKKEINSDFEINSVIYNETMSDLFIATMEEKLSVYNVNKRNLKTFSEKEFSADVSCFYFDSESNLWIGTPGKGLYRVTHTNYEFISTDIESVYAIAQDESYNTYLGTKKGILVKDNNYKTIQTITSLNSKDLGKVTALYFQKQTLWIGTEKNGLYILDRKKNALLKPEFSAISNIGINSITGKENEITVSTNLDGVYIYDSTVLVRHFSVENGLIHNNVYHAIKTKSNRTIYATHNTSFNYSEGNELFEIDLKAIGLNADFNGFAEDSFGNVYIATNGDGVYILKDLHIELFECNDKLRTQFCGGLLFDKEENLWIIQSDNLYKCNIKDKILTSPSIENDIPFVFNSKARFLSKHGDVWFGTDKNLLIFHPDTLKAKLPFVYISSLKINDSVVGTESNLKLPSGNYDLEFEFSAICLKNSEDVTFSYLLEGRDKEWTDAGASRKVKFSQLSEGNYTLKLKAKNASGFSMPNAFVFEFNIRPPFWKSPLFWILSSITLIMSVLGIVRIRTRHLVKAKVELEKKVAEKTVQLQEEKQQVIKSKKLIQEQNEEIVDSITYAKRIQEALLTDKNLIHQFKTNLFVFYQPRDIVSGDFYWMAEVNNLKIIVAADCTGHGVPGALMSMVGSTLLNKIILERKISQPKYILESLDEEIKLALKQYTYDATRDGMDLCLVCINEKRSELTYAGAMRPLYQIRNKTLIEHEPTKHAIGGFSYGKVKEFSETKIKLQKEDRFYLFSDGYADQFGGEKGKKFMLKNFKTLLLNTSELEMQEQKNILSSTYAQWKGDAFQIDDVMVIGIKI